MLSSDGENKFTDESLIISNTVQFFYKMQKIVTYEKDLIGYEVLLDFAKAQKLIDNGLVEYTRAINDGRALDYLLSSFLTREVKLNNTMLFINVERMNLCNKFLLLKIRSAAKKLFVEANIVLIVEVTERNPCGYCVDIMDGLIYLKSSGVRLAIDDYNCYGEDFRRKEINAGIYDFVKIEMPRSACEVISFNAFSMERKEKIIIEMVEDHGSLLQVGLTTAFGYQGFAYP